jgi:hypothetical protein
MVTIPASEGTQEAQQLS